MMIATTYKNNFNKEDKKGLDKKLKIISNKSHDDAKKMTIKLQRDEKEDKINEIFDKLKSKGIISISKQNDKENFLPVMNDNRNALCDIIEKKEFLKITRNKRNLEINRENQAEELQEKNKLILPNVIRNRIGYHTKKIEIKTNYYLNSIDLKSNQNTCINRSLSREKKNNSINKKKLSLLRRIKYMNSDKTPKQNKTNHTYIIRRGNNKALIKSILNLRLNWKENPDHSSRNYDYIWSLSKFGIDFNNMSPELPLKKMANHFEFDSEIYNKKFMFINFLEFCHKNNLNIFDYLPFTLILSFKGKNFKNNFSKFKEIFSKIDHYVANDSSQINQHTSGKNSMNYNELFKCDLMNYKYSDNTIYIPSTHYAGKNYWLLKPTDLSGGKCIKIADTIEGLEKTIKKFYDGIEKDNKKFTAEKNEEENLESTKKKSYKRYFSGTVILQKYIESPLLYYGRKFDIRIWVLIDYKFNVYIFREGHLKTCSTEYTIGSKNKFAHITNYMLQKHNKDFQKFEEGNEVSFKDFQKCLDTEYTDRNMNVFRDILPQIKKTIEYTTLSVKEKININERRYSYVVLGYDFMIDSNFKAWLIEINRNPGMVESSKLIKSLIPRMLDEVFRLTVDTVFEPKFDKNDNENYKSPFPVDGYEDTENVFEFICNLNTGHTKI